MQIIDPEFAPSEPDRQLLERCVHASVLGKPSPLSAHERRVLSDRIATAAAWALLRQLEPKHQVIDANQRRRNQPGYDFLVDEHVRLQVKGGTFVESIGWSHSANVDAVDLSFDVMIAVDIGVTLDGRVGRLAEKNLPRKESVDYYVIPVSVVKNWIMKGQHVNKRGAHIYLYKRELRPGSKEEIGQTRELTDWKNRFDAIEAAVARSPNRPHSLS